MYVNLKFGGSQALSSSMKSVLRMGAQFAALDRRNEGWNRLSRGACLACDKHWRCPGHLLIVTDSAVRGFARRNEGRLKNARNVPRPDLRIWSAGASREMRFAPTSRVTGEGAG